jgi:hypothetical protein
MIQSEFGDGSVLNLNNKINFPGAVAVRSEARIFFARSNIGIVGSNSVRGMDVCLRFPVLALSCVGLCDRLIPRPRDYTNSVRFRSFQINFETGTRLIRERRRKITFLEKIIAV